MSIQRMDTVVLDTGLVLPKTSGTGIKIDIDTPAFGYRDMIGILRPDLAGANAPTLIVFRGGLTREYMYQAADKMDMNFHMPHDYVPGTDLLIHTHWGHNGTNITSNTATITYGISYGDRQGLMSAEKTVVWTDTNVTIGNTPQYFHRVDEVPISNAGGTGGLFDRSIFKVDGILNVNLTFTTVPTVTGGTTPRIAIFFCDLHYQSTNVGTKNSASPFYG